MFFLLIPHADCERTEGKKNKQQKRMIHKNKTGTSKRTIQNYAQIACCLHGIQHCRCNLNIRQTVRPVLVWLVIMSLCNRITYTQKKGTKNRNEPFFCICCTVNLPGIIFSSWRYKGNKLQDRKKIIWNVNCIDGRSLSTFLPFCQMLKELIQLNAQKNAQVMCHWG